MTQRLRASFITNVKFQTQTNHQCCHPLHGVQLGRIESGVIVLESNWDIYLNILENI